MPLRHDVVSHPPIKGLWYTHMPSGAEFMLTISVLISISYINSSDRLVCASEPYYGRVKRSIQMSERTYHHASVAYLVM